MNKLAFLLLEEQGRWRNRADSSCRNRSINVPVGERWIRIPFLRRRSGKWGIPAVRGTDRSFVVVCPSSPRSSLCRSCNVHGRSYWLRLPCPIWVARDRINLCRSPFWFHLKYNFISLIHILHCTKCNCRVWDESFGTKSETLQIYAILPITVGSRSTKMALGTCWPVLVSKKNELNESLP